MRTQDLFTNTESDPAAKSLAAFAIEGIKTLHTKDLPNATAQPFKEWNPPRMKTGLRNSPIGRKVAIVRA